MTLSIAKAKATMPAQEFEAWREKTIASRKASCRKWYTKNGRDYYRKKQDSILSYRKMRREKDRAYQREYNRKNAHKINARRREWYKKKRQNILDARKELYWADVGQSRLKMRKKAFCNRTSHPEMERARVQKWRQKNWRLVAEYQAKYRGRRAAERFASSLNEDFKTLTERAKA